MDGVPWTGKEKSPLERRKKRKREHWGGSISQSRAEDIARRKSQALVTATVGGERGGA